MKQRHIWLASGLLAMGSIATPVALAETNGTAPTATPPAVVAPATAASPLTKEQAIEMALKAHPGQVTKAYEDTKQGKKAWEVKIKGDDGKKWEVYYDMATGELIDEEGE